MEFLSSLTISDSDTPLLLEKRLNLLIAIDEIGSISGAAKSVPMSYKSAWDAITAINNLCPTPVVVKETGGVGGGGAKVTTYGKNLIKTYSILQQEHAKFLSQLTKMTDFNTGALKSIGRVAMQISARNQLRGVVHKIAKGSVNSNIILVPKSGHELFSNISTSSISDLGIKEGEEVVAIFKSSNVLLATGEGIAISGRNKIKGIIKNISFGEVNCEITLDIGDEESITSVITTDAVKQMDLKVGMSATAIIKSNDIMIGK